jgi:hypothetical protein
MTTSIAHQSVEALGGAGSVLVRQRLDHELLPRLRAALDDRQFHARGGREHALAADRRGGLR